MSYDPSKEQVPFILSSIVVQSIQSAAAVVGAWVKFVTDPLMIHTPMISADCRRNAQKGITKD